MMNENNDQNKGKRSGKIFWWIAGLAVACTMCATCTGSDSDPEGTYRENGVLIDTTKKSPLLTQAEQDSVDALQYETKLQEELRNIEKAIEVIRNWDESYSTVENMGAAAQAFDDLAYVARMTEAGLSGFESEDSVQLEKLATSLRKQLKQLQIREFPKIRSEFGKLMDRRMWEYDVDVKTNRTGSRGLVFIGGHFFANRNIKESYESGYKTWQKMRFTRVDFKAYEGEREWTYYTLDSKPDGDLRW